MKRAIFLTTGSFLVLMTACSKKYTCSCTDGTGNVVYTEEIEAQTDAEAKESCAALGTECTYK